MLQLTAKNSYLDSWYNGAVSGVANDSGDIYLDEVVKMSTMENAQSLAGYFSRSKQVLANLKQQKTCMLSYKGKKESGVVVTVVTHR